MPGRLVSRTGAPKWRPEAPWESPYTSGPAHLDAVAGGCDPPLQRRCIVRLQNANPHCGTLYRGCPLSCCNPGDTCGAGGRHATTCCGDECPGLPAADKYRAFATT